MKLPFTRSARPDLVFAKAGDPCAKDAVAQRETTNGPVLEGAYGGQSEEELAAQGYVLWNTDTFAAHVEEILTTHPTPVSAERFQEMLNVMPPVWWHIESNCESFHLQEPYSGRITSHYVRLGKRCFEFKSKPLRHAEAVEKVRQWVYAGVTAISAGWNDLENRVLPWKVEGTHPQGDWEFRADNEEEVVAIYQEYKAVQS